MKGGINRTGVSAARGRGGETDRKMGIAFPPDLLPQVTH